MQEKVDGYLANRGSLKKDFNQCHYQYDKLRKANKCGEANESIRSSQCPMVSRAASAVKVYSFDKPMQ